MTGRTVTGREERDTFGDFLGSVLLGGTSHPTSVPPSFDREDG